MESFAQITVETAHKEAQTEEDAEKTLRAQLEELKLQLMWTCAFYTQMQQENDERRE